MRSEVTGKVAVSGREQSVDLFKSFLVLNDTSCMKPDRLEKIAEK
jgi:hypothetical protein